jgi:Uma2 family endonuclease
MRTVVLGDHHYELTEWIARRRALGQDHFDEVWNGEYHAAPAPNLWHAIVAGELTMVLGALAVQRGLRCSTEFNLGVLDDFRVPDLGLHRTVLHADWLATAAMVVEVVSSEDESWLKFDHYAAHGVDEVLIADPADSSLHLFVLVAGEYQPSDRSRLLDVTVAELHDGVDWPGAGDPGRR